MKELEQEKVDNFVHHNKVEPSSIEEAIQNEHWVVAMNEELDQIEKNNTLELVP